MTIDRQALRERRRHGSVMQRRDLGHVRHGRDGARGRRLIGYHDGGSSRKRYYFAALHVLVRALLRRAYQHGEEQRRKQSVQQERREEASRQSFWIAPVPRIAPELHRPGPNFTALTAVLHPQEPAGSEAQG
ncbi:MAG: hypothetical protein ACLQHL_01635 [Candidatus Cybelea sp.]